MEKHNKITKSIEFFKNLNRKPSFWIFLAHIPSIIYIIISLKMVGGLSAALVNWDFAFVTLVFMPITLGIVSYEIISFFRPKIDEKNK